MTARARVLFTLCLMSLLAIAYSIFAASPGLSHREGSGRDEQIGALQNQIRDLNHQLGELKKENPNAATPPVSKPKHAILNLSYVIKNYKKWAKFQEEYKNKLDQYDAQLKSLKETYEATENLRKTTTDTDDIDKIDKELRDLRNRISDKTEDGKKVLAAMESKQFSEIYKDVQTATERYAKAHELEMVSHFNDGTTEAEVNNPVNIGRKMSQGGLFPLYITPGMDISKEVLALLNDEKDGAQERPGTEE